MQQPQLIFDRTIEAKSKMKQLKNSFREALVNNKEYVDLLEKIKSLKEKAKQVEQSIAEGFQRELTEIEDLKIDLASDMEMLSDVALTQVMKGETLEIKDKYENQYEPIFKVSFKKSNS